MNEATPAPPVLHALLEGILDYAGLFPPASLDLPSALATYARHRRDPHAWMLGRFVLPVQRLPELTSHRADVEADPPFRLALLGTGGPDADAALAGLTADLAATDALRERHAGRVRADVLEVRLPPDLVGAPGLDDFLAAAHARLAEAGAASMDLFFELPLDDRLEQTAPSLIEALRRAREANPSSPFRMGLKMRMGGTEPGTFPAPEPVAFLIARLREAGVRFKATAGLHHPLRHFHAPLRSTMHGFLNVFGAAVLAQIHALPEERILEILRDEDPSDFRFTRYTFAWRDFVATPDGIRHARAHLATSFGSCSFDEPRDELRALGFLDA